MEKLDDNLLNDCKVIEAKNFEKKKLRLMTKNMYDLVYRDMSNRSSTFLEKRVRVIASFVWSYWR
jgi:hypothetical protein